MLRVLVRRTTRATLTTTQATRMMMINGRSASTFNVTHNADGSDTLSSRAGAAVYSTPPRRSAASKASASIARQHDDAASSNGMGDESELSDASSPPASPTPPPAKKARTSKGKAKAKAEAGEEGGEAAAEEGEQKAPKKRAKREPKPPIETHVNEDGVEVYTSDGTPARRNKKGNLMRPRAPKVTDIDENFAGPIILHEVQRRDFAGESTAGKPFTGRLGFACLNTVLRAARPNPIFSSRTCRIKSLQEKGMAWVHELARQNVRDIVPMLEWNAKYGIRFMRLSSEMFPFASHLEYGYGPKDVAADELKRAGDKAKELGIRITMHPGQFTQLGSPKPGIIDAAVRELQMHTDILDGMGVGPDGVLIVHGGGTYMDRKATLARIKDTIQNRLPPEVRARVVLENDEMAYSAEELLPICEELDVPLVFDFHHDALRPSAAPPSELLPRINAIWQRRGIRPKYHLSEPRAGARNLRERRAHSDRCMRLPPDLPPDADLMIEAKDKEQAVFELFRIYGLVPTEQIERVIRPPAGMKMQGMQGAGKKAVTVKKDYAGVKAGAAAAGEEGASPRKKQENQNEMAIRLLKRAREMAKKRGKEYTGPGANIKLDDDEDAESGSAVLTARDEDPKSKFSAEEVYQDMLKRADEIRAHLRETNSTQRPKYDGNGFEGEHEDLVDDAVDGEDDAGIVDTVEKVVGTVPPGQPAIGGEADAPTVVA